MFNKNTYIERREKLKSTVGSGVLLFLGNDEQGLHYADNCFRYRQDSSFLYFFGINKPGLNAIIDIDNDRDIIFGDELTIDSIVWMGQQPSLREICDGVGITDVRPSAELPIYLANSKSVNQEIHYLPTYRAEHQLKLMEYLGIKVSEIVPSINFIRAIVNQRNYKTAEEIIEIEKACNITADMHIEAIRMLKAGMSENQIAAAVESVAKNSGASLSFPIIATINGQTLHNHYHGNIAKSGQLFLLDAGAETEMGYAGDMSSTFPVDNKFTDRQREIYEIQNAMHINSVQALKPGIPFEEVYDISARTLIEGMKSLNLMKGDTEEALKCGAHALFYPHGLGHMMGLDVHDMENFGEVWVGYDGKPKSTQFGRKSLRLARPLEPGFVLTIEPGIYFIPDLIDLWRSEGKFQEFINYEKVESYKDFGGIRNEEDYLITEDGGRRLGKKIPLTIEEVEALR